MVITGAGQDGRVVVFPGTGLVDFWSSGAQTAAVTMIGAFTTAGDAVVCVGEAEAGAGTDGSCSFGDFWGETTRTRLRPPPVRRGAALQVKSSPVEGRDLPDNC